MLDNKETVMRIRIILVPPGDCDEYRDSLSTTREPVMTKGIF